VDIQKILTKLRITALNEMQQHAAEAIFGSDGDVVLLSPTGTGKTLAYQLPLVQLLDAASDDVQALVITPGRELADFARQPVTADVPRWTNIAC